MGNSRVLGGVAGKAICTEKCGRNGAFAVKDSLLAGADQACAVVGDCRVVRNVSIAIQFHSI